jgi:hypothetical protein
MEQMKYKNIKGSIRGWFPQEPNGHTLSRSHRFFGRKTRVALFVAGSVVLVVGGFFLVSFLGFLLFPIVPADVRIYNTISENKDLLESIDGVLAAGIGGNGTGHIAGINIYIDANMTNTAAIPEKLGDYPVFLVRIDNSQPRDRTGFLWYSPDLKLWPLETPGAT